KRLIDAIVDGIKSAGGAIASAISSVVPGPLKSIASHVPGIGGLFHAQGGPMVAGQVGIVGESGPELFVAPQNGVVLPNRSFNTLQRAINTLSPIGAASGGPAVVINTAVFRDEADIEVLLRKAEFAVQAGRL